MSDVDFLRRRIDIEQQVKLLGGRVTIGKPKGGKTRAVLPDGAEQAGQGGRS